jgi:RND family efflux transporter MFP subunit
MNDRLTTDLASLRIDRDAKPPRQGTARRIAIGLVLAVVAGAGVVAYPRIEQLLFKTTVAVTQVALVSPAQASVKVTATGYVVPQLVSDVGAKVSGRVAEVRVKEGDIVAKGAVLARLEDADARSLLASAQSRVASARANVEVPRANLAEVAIEIARDKKLVERGVTPSATLETLEARARSLEAQVRAAEAAVRAASAEAAAAQVALDNLVIAAPIAGTVIRKPLGVGELALPGVPVTRIADFSTLLVETDVPEGRLHLVEVSGPCEVVLDARPSKRYRAQTVEMGTQVERAKATVKVKVKILDDAVGVLPDMAARVSFLDEPLTEEAAKEPPKLVVAADAVVEREGQRVVFVVEDGRARRAPVLVGGPYGGGLELVEGPAAGTRIVSAPPASLRDGQSVKQKDE